MLFGNPPDVPAQMLQIEYIQDLQERLHLGYKWARVHRKEVPNDRRNPMTLAQVHMVTEYASLFGCTQQCRKKGSIQNCKSFGMVPT